MYTFFAPPLMFALAAWVVWRMAAAEERSPVAWTFTALPLGVALAASGGLMGYVAPGLTIVGAFVALWIARHRAQGPRDRRLR